MQTTFANGSEIEPKMRDVIKDIYRKRGFLFFYTGFLACILRTFPVDAITISLFDYINERIDDAQLV